MRTSEPWSNWIHNLISWTIGCLRHGLAKSQKGWIYLIYNMDNHIRWWGEKQSHRYGSSLPRRSSQIPTSPILSPNCSWSSSLHPPYKPLVTLNGSHRHYSYWRFPPSRTVAQCLLFPLRSDGSSVSSWWLSSLRVCGRIWSCKTLYRSCKCSSPWSFLKCKGRSSQSLLLGIIGSCILLRSTLLCTHRCRQKSNLWFAEQTVRNRNQIGSLACSKNSGLLWRHNMLHILLVVLHCLCGWSNLDNLLFVEVF